MQDNEKKPALRFKGFTDPWEQRKLDEAFDFTVPNNTLSRAELNQESGSVRNVHYGDVLIKYGSVLDAQNDELPFITGRSKDDFKGALLQNGDIIIADTAEDETTGKVCEIVNIQDKDVVAGLHTMVCRPKNKTAEGYFGYYMNSSSYHHQLLPLMQGIKVLSLSKTNVQKTTVKYPKDKAEQQKIADCLRRIDTLITLHQRKYEKLVNIKKSMLDKMFPKNGASVPEIRFKGFTDPWEQRKLGDAFERVVRKNTNNESRLPLTISAQDGLVDQITYFNNRVASRDVSNYYLVYNGEFAYNKSTSDGYPFGAVKRLDWYEKGVLSTLYIVFALKHPEKDDSDFMTVFYDTDRWHRGVAERAAEGARNHGLLNISADDFFDIDTTMPEDKVEQEKIGRLLKKLDTLITLHQRKLEKLQNIKKSCLEKMFV
mgnify:CR=1 FL=1